VNVPYITFGKQMANSRMGRLADGANITGITLFGIAAADIQMWLTLVATVLGIIATAFTIWFHVARLLKERQK
jgi:hypothetical protein